MCNDRELGVTRMAVKRTIYDQKENIIQVTEDERNINNESDTKHWVSVCVVCVVLCCGVCVAVTHMKYTLKAVQQTQPD